ncbi:ZZ-type zinc finger-containing protein 3 isoform X1 [Poeciliopsis prolifica]|uniref:ZZ-type zinc finger-containing protein 3 isoform X1 n=1 Tax=Poeciliopsis prolifica TaxID=188132 RepID=UPI00241440A0|nr:ZZ-type zinc finger-containing protein 3 isoform X1 [Poeciliopsis prolifica]
MAASRSSRVTRSSVGLNGLDEKFCGRTLRNRSIAQPEETSVSPQPRARSPKKKQESKQDANKDNRQESKHDARKESRHDNSKDSKQESKQDSSKDSKQESSQHANKVSKQESKPDTSKVSKQEAKQDTSKNSKQESKQDTSKNSKQESKQDTSKNSKQESKQDTSKNSKQESKQDTSKDPRQESKQNNSKESKQESKKDTNKDSTQESKQKNSKDSKQNSKQNTSKDSIKESEQDIVKEWEQDIVKESEQDAVKESEQDAVKESGQDAVKESGQDAVKESEQDAVKESEHDVLKELEQDALKESEQDALKESEQDALESEQDALKESKQDAVKESRLESNDNKEDNKQDTGEKLNKDFETESKHAAKHDTEPQETSLQESQQLDMLQRNIADSSIPAGDEDHSTVSRKRGMTHLEKDLKQEKSENCDTGKEWRNTSPPIKRAKQCSLSGEFLGHEEDQGFLNPQSQVSVLEPCKDLICEDLPSHNSCNAPPASSILSEQEGEVIGRQVKEDHCMDCDGPVLPQNSHKASNGLRETDAEKTSTVTEHPSATPTSTTSFPSLLNGSQMEAPSSPDSSVPFRNSVPGQMEVSGSGESPASSALTFMGAVEDPVPELIMAKEQEVEEVEVDVVGDPLGLAHEEQVTVTEGDTNGRSPSPVQEPAASTLFSTANVNCSSVNNSNSGETMPTPTTPQSPTEPECNPSMSSMTPSFTELNEHRYTLRTSPRRVVSGGKTSPSKPSSPITDNGPFREEGEVEDDCPMLEEPSCSDSVGLSIEEPGSVNPSCRVGEKDSDFMEDKEAENGKELTRSEAVEEEEEEEEEEEPDVYYFESDHLALKHNKDYQRLLQTIVVLEAQRAQAILDLETLARQQREALSEPISFVEQLQKQANLGLPCPQRVVQLPDIAWEQYTSGLGEFEREFCDKKRKTRQLKLIFDKGLPLRPKSPVEPKKEGESSAVYSSLPTSDAPENGRQTQMIRGRICHPNKPDTFNQLWTVEEQKKLEQLLVKFPPEEVESKRWQKIADELGNRTAKQVASRVQKYFIKLTKAGIPVPGRTPNLCMYTKKASSKRQHHLNKHLYRPSTFLTSYEPPVYMEDEDERAAFYHSVQDPSADESDEESVPVELRSLQEYKELLQLKRLKKQKLQEIRKDNAGVQHMGYKCDVCGMEPIQGVRWHCQDCPPENSVDFCSNCSDCLFKTETHKPDHHLEAVYQPDTFLDRDYCLPQSAGYNYLDPNYFPANR